MATDYQAILLALLQGWSWRRIQSDLRCSRRTISRAKAVVDERGLTVEQVEELSVADVASWFPDGRARNDGEYLAPDFDALVAKIARSSKRVTLRVEHEKYCRKKLSEGQKHYSYKQFLKLFSQFVDTNSLQAMLYHVPGIDMQVDWAGDVMHIVNPYEKALVKAYIFVASLPHSGMIFACAKPDLKMRSWLSAHDEAFSYFGSVPQFVIPDNAPTATNRVCAKMRARDVNEQYRRFSEYFGFAIMPAGVYEPTHKGHVESAVHIV